MEDGVEITIKDVIKQGKRKNKNIDKNLIEKAYLYADEKHKNQLRKSGEPYIIHPIHVAYIVAKLGLDTQTICSALMHDLIEDTEVTYNDIKERFGAEIAQIVDGVTKLSTLFNTTEEKQAENYKKMFIAMEKDIRVILVKLADRLHNISTLEYLREDRQIAIAKETIELYAPIAHKLGMYDLKMKLQDESFKYLYAEDYKKIVKELERKKKENNERLNKSKEIIEKELKKQRIPAILNIETKHLYNIYTKIKEKKITIDQIQDLFALKIITKNKKDCYRILGIINTIYKLLPETFKDYIAIPRNNKYQAIHEIISGEKGVIVEVQICTYDMNKIAKYGIANYFPYLKNENINQEEKEFKDKLEGVYNSLELKQIVSDPKEFLNTLKTELFDDEVYIFTPKGDIEVLPKGAIAIDFAYHISEETGRHIKECKINSISMPITTKLKNGNIVEIITSKEECIPKKEWLENIKTAKAKSQVIKQLSKNELLEKEKYLVEIIAEDRDNLILEITQIFAQNRLNIVAVNTGVKDSKEKINITMETRKLDKIEKLKQQLSEIKNIDKITIEKALKN